MSYQFNILTQQQAETIAFTWHYEGKYSFYDMEADQEDLAEFLDMDKRKDSAYAVIKDQALVGFITVNRVDDQTVDLGLGMKPNLTGKGLGRDFLTEIMAFIQLTYKPSFVTLAVAAFNQRAINLYLAYGFQKVELFMQATNGSHFEFLKMRYVVNQQVMGTKKGSEV